MKDADALTVNPPTLVTLRTVMKPVLSQFSQRLRRLRRKARAKPRQKPSQAPIPPQFSARLREWMSQNIVIPARQNAEAGRANASAGMLEQCSSRRADQAEASLGSQAASGASDGPSHQPVISRQVDVTTRAGACFHYRRSCTGLLSECS